MAIGPLGAVIGGCLAIGHCIAFVITPLAVVKLIALFDRSRGTSDGVVIAAQVLFCLTCIGLLSDIIECLAHSNRPEDPAKGKKIGLTVLKMSIMLASAVTMGIALFDRSRGIDDGVVIAAAVLFFTGSIFICILGMIKNSYDPKGKGSNIENSNAEPVISNQYQQK